MKKNLIAAASVLFVLSAGFIFTACKKENKTVVHEIKKEPQQLILRYAENQPQDYPTTQAAYKFAELVEQRTDGRIHIDVYPNGQLGDEKAVIEQLQFGGIDFSRVSISPLSELEKSLNVLQLPYLYKDSAQMWRVLDGEIGDNFLNSVGKYGLMGLSWFDSGARNFYNSKKPITKLEDLKDLKIRVQESKLMMGMVTALGANPVPMSYGDVYQGLLSGKIDGAENNWPSYDSASHFQAAKYYVLDEHTRIPEIQLVSKILWEKLNPDDQIIIRKCAMESAKFERELWAKKEAASEEKLKGEGVEITKLAAGEKEKFQAAMIPLYTQFGSENMDLVKQIQKK